VASEENQVKKPVVIHYDHPDLWDINICGVRGTWSANGNVKKVTCKRCRRHLTYWVKKEIKARYGNSK
jgi:hypothetical protein